MKGWPQFASSHDDFTDDFLRLMADRGIHRQNNPLSDFLITGYAVMAKKRKQAHREKYGGFTRNQSLPPDDVAPRVHSAVRRGITPPPPPPPPRRGVSSDARSRTPVGRAPRPQRSPSPRTLGDFIDPSIASFNTFGPAAEHGGSLSSSSGNRNRTPPRRNKIQWKN